MSLTKDEVLKLAKECGAGCHRDCTGEPSYSMYDDQLLSFANAIADLQREKDAKICESLRGADWYKHSEAIRANKE